MAREAKSGGIKQKMRSATERQQENKAGKKDDICRIIPLESTAISRTSCFKSSPVQDHVEDFAADTQRVLGTSEKLVLREVLEIGREVRENKLSRRDAHQRYREKNQYKYS